MFCKKKTMKDEVIVTQVGAEANPRMLPFVKMHGLGNDFVILEAANVPEETDLSRLAATLCDRKFGIGADGLIVVSEPTDPSQYDVRFVYLNGDGSWAEMCGNGIRCFALYVYDQGILKQETFRVETLAGLVTPRINPDRTVTVDMGEPVLKPEAIPFAEGHEAERISSYPLQVLEETVLVTLVSMGNPHCMVFQQDLPQRADPSRFGPALEVHPAFPAKTNVEFVDVVDRHTVDVVVWERGCGFTLACGTGACATAVACVLEGKTDERVDVRLPGGTLGIFWDHLGNNRVMMTGPAAYVFQGQVRIDF